MLTASVRKLEAVRPPGGRRYRKLGCEHECRAVTAKHLRMSAQCSAGGVMFNLSIPAGLGDLTRHAATDTRPLKAFEPSRQLGGKGRPTPDLAVWPSASR
jgi:hypothetical protein